MSLDQVNILKTFRNCYFKYMFFHETLKMTSKTVKIEFIFYVRSFRVYIFFKKDSS